MKTTKGKKRNTEKKSDKKNLELTSPSRPLTPSPPRLSSTTPSDGEGFSAEWSLSQV